MLKIMSIIIMVILGVTVTPLVSFALNAESVYLQAGKYVYIVYGMDESLQRRVGLASAVSVARNLLATNCHVARKSRGFQVKVGQQFLPAILSYQNTAQDLCLIKVPGANFKPAEFRLSRDVRVGEDVFAIGNPHGLEKSISRGIISNKHPVRDVMILQTDATISFGSSGGGLFDKNAKLIGITRAGHRYKDIAFAVPTEWIQSLIDEKDRSPRELLNGENLKKIGEYGSDKIALYRWDRRCFLYFISDALIHQQGAIMWFPDLRNTVFFLPAEKNIYRNLKAMKAYDYLEKKELKNRRSSIMSQLLLPSQVIVQTFNDDPAITFTRSTYIQLALPNLYYRDEMVAMRFGMMGFKKALEAYHASCPTLNKN